MHKTKRYSAKEGAPGYRIDEIVKDLRQELNYVAEEEGSTSITKWFRLKTKFIPAKKEMEAVLQTLGWEYWPDPHGFGKARDQSADNYSRHKVINPRAHEFKRELRSRIETIIRIESQRR